MNRDELRFSRIDGQSEIFEVHLGSTDVGIVWLRDGVWYGDAVSMMSPTIMETSRSLAADKLLERHAKASSSSNVGPKDESSGSSPEAK